MLSYILKCRKNTEIKDPRVAKINKRKPMPLSKRAVCDSEKLRLIKEQEASELITSLLGFKAPFEGIPILGSVI